MSHQRLKKFNATVVISFIWFASTVFVMNRYAPDALLVVASFALNVFVTYWLLSWVANTPSQERKAVPSQRQRVEAWLESLDDDELEDLRHRLKREPAYMGDDYATFNELITKRKRES